MRATFSYTRSDITYDVEYLDHLHWQDVDDYMIRRFLRARDLDIEKASNMFLKYLKWKQIFAPTGSITASEIATDIEQKKMFTQGSDKTGRPILVVFPGRHFPRKGGLEEFKRMFSPFNCLLDG